MMASFYIFVFFVENFLYFAKTSQVLLLENNVNRYIILKNTKEGYKVGSYLY